MGPLGAVASICATPDGQAEDVHPERTTFFSQCKLHTFRYASRCMLETKLAIAEPEKVSYVKLKSSGKARRFKFQ